MFLVEPTQDINYFSLQPKLKNIAYVFHVFSSIAKMHGYHFLIGLILRVITYTFFHPASSHIKV